MLSPVGKGKYFTATEITQRWRAVWWPISLFRNSHYESKYRFEIELKI